MSARLTMALAAFVALLACTSSSTGPAGPAGPTGPQGPPGPTGPTGPAGPGLETLVPGCTAGQFPRFDGTAWTCASKPACVTVTINNRNDGTGTKYGRFDLPFECHPPTLSPGYPASAPADFGCTAELWVEHHSGNNAGYWRGHRSADFTIFPNGEGSGHAYLQIWDYSSANLIDIENTVAERLLENHWVSSRNVCAWTDAYYNGTTWTITTPRTGGGWKDMGLSANVYTRCTLRICEKDRDAGTYSIAERTSGPLTDE
jgi:hypothetical protein